MPLLPPGVASSHVQPDGSCEPSISNDQVPDNLPVDLTIGRASTESPGLTLKGSDEISNVTLYVGIIDKVLEYTSLSVLV